MLEKKIIFGTTFFILLLFNFSVYCQIEDIKDDAFENKNKKNNLTDSNVGSSDDSNSDIGSAIAEGCAEGCMDACFEIGCSVMVGFIGEYTSTLYQTKPEDPSILSLDINANLALGYQYSYGDFYHYINYLPGLRANLVSFLIDFRYNLLAQYVDGFPDAFKSWHLDLAFNIVPDKSLKIGVGMGVQNEITTKSYFHEYFLCAKIGLKSNIDYIDFDMRTSYDYETGVFPFFETGARYNKRFFDSENLSSYISLGAIYQNYYESNDIWAIRGGVIFNIH